MAGSKRWFQYVMDDGEEVGINLDESNTEAINGTAANVPPPGSRPTRNIPAGTTPRSIYYANAAGTRIIRVVALNQTIYNAIPANSSTIPDPITSGQTLSFIYKRCEKSKFPRFGADTGLNDGDTPG